MRLIGLFGTLFSALFLAASYCFAGALDYRTHAEVIQKDGCPYLMIRHFNAGGESMYFQPDEPAVLVMDSSRRTLPFIGIIAKRPPYRLDEHIQLPPGESFQREISLRESYGITRAGKYYVVINVDYFDPVALKGHEKGNVVIDFRYSGQCKKRRFGKHNEWAGRPD